MRAETPIDEDAVVWSHPADERDGRPLLVFMHGYGGHEQDWADWFPELPPGTAGASLRAPAPVAARWAWVDLEPKMTSSSGLPKLSAAARAVRHWIERQHPPQVVLVGWSQGGTLAAHMVRQQPRRFTCAVVVAGFVADTSPHKGVRAARPPVWYGVGGRDDVIPEAMVTRSRRWLAEHTAATIVDLPDEDHMLSPGFVRPAMHFVATALGRAG